MLEMRLFVDSAPLPTAIPMAHGHAVTITETNARIENEAKKEAKTSNLETSHYMS